MLEKGVDSYLNSCSDRASEVGLSTQLNNVIDPLTGVAGAIDIIVHNHLPDQYLLSHHINTGVTPYTNTGVTPNKQRGYTRQTSLTTSHKHLSLQHKYMNYIKQTLVLQQSVTKSQKH